MALAIVSAIAVSACVSAPASRPQLTVVQGGAGSPATPAPTKSAVPEPPLGVIMSGRVVIGCEYGTRCTYFARISPISPERPDPTTSPVAGAAMGVTLTGAGGASRGFGPTARDGRPGDQEPVDIATLVAGTWHIDIAAWATLPGRDLREVGLGTGRASCGMDFVLKPGDSLAFRVAALSGDGCSIRVAGTQLP